MRLAIVLWQFGGEGGWEWGKETLPLELFFIKTSVTVTVRRVTV